MSLQTNVWRESVAGAARARAERIESRLKKYPPARAAAVRALAGEHPALADLSVSFPALLFALAAPRDAEAARRGIAAVRAGRSLRAAAGEIGLPMWLRALPPEAFADPLAHLPDGPVFARRIANHWPALKLAQDWLVLVAHAARWGDEAVAVWVAQEFNREPKKFDAAGLTLVCLWAFLSSRPETKAGRLAAKRWSPRMSYAHALEEARDWSQSVELVCWLGEGEAYDGWLAPAVVDGFAFAPLASAALLIDEAAKMRNCLRTYGETLQAGSCRLWSVRRDGERVATVEIGALGCRAGPITVTQANGRENRDVGPQVARAIQEWLRAQPVTDAPSTTKAQQFRRAEWLAFWRPYWLAKRALPAWLPLAPSQDALRRLRWGPRRYRRRRRIALPRPAGMI